MLGDVEEQQRSPLVGSPPTFRNFVDFVEHGTSEDKDPSKVETAEARQARHKLMKATALCLFFMVFEVVGGYLAGSLAIMTDAAHLLSDVAGFLISLFALYLGNRKATLTHSFGFKRAEILGALLSVMLIWFLTGVLLWEAILRTQGIIQDTRDSTVDGKLMFGVATIGLVVNMLLLFVLGHDHSHLGGGHGHSHDSSSNDHGHSHSSKNNSHGHSHSSKSNSHGHSDNNHGHSHSDNNNDHGHSHSSNSHGHNHSSSSSNDHDGHSSDENEELLNTKHDNINVSAAYAHAIGDLIQSAGVCIAGALIWAFPGEEHRLVQLADPIATFLFSVLVLYSTYSIIKTSMNVLMEGVPDGIDPVEIAGSLLSIQDVIGVHHLHIWSLTVGEPSLSVHVVANDDGDMDKILAKAQHMLRKHNISHSTVQIERFSRDICETENCVGTVCESFAINCDDNGNCYSQFRTNQNSNSNSGYGSF